MIKPEDYQKAAEVIGCDIAVIMAVAHVESNGAGFDEKGRVKILFEPHKFWAQLQKQKINPNDYVKGNEDILYPKWNKNGYGKLSIQYDKLNRAIKINETAALMSCSWGMFQIMGSNYDLAGYFSVQSMVQAFSLGEGEQLIAFSHFIVSSRMDDELREKDFEGFARQYNGPLYKTNDYDGKLLLAYRDSILNAQKFQLNPSSPSSE